MGAANTLVGGLLGLIAALGIGCGVTACLGRIPDRWRLAASLVSGVAVIDWVVTLVLFTGGGVAAIKVVGIAAAALGGILLLVFRKRLCWIPRLKPSSRAEYWIVAVIIAACAINLFIAVAPSTKIDELHYHMLVPRRVLQDNQLHLYRLPYEAAIFPQMSYQLGLATEQAAGFPEAGNVLSWGLGLALLLLIAGITSDLSASATAGWMTAAIAAVGLYPAVWHVTSGPHALGDLATVTACLLALLPDRQTAKLTPRTKLILICLAAYAAASTKISNLPVAAAITLAGVYRASAVLSWRKAIATALAIWAAFYGPILLWTTLQSGSPLGLATAALFHSHYFGPEALANIREAKDASPKGVMPLVKWIAPSVSIGMVVAFGVVVWAACKRLPTAMAICALVCGQAILIYLLLPPEFRFLGGLQYVVLIVGAWVAWPSAWRQRLAGQWWLLLILLCLPWLGVQIYYARPFLKVDAGLTSRDAFRNEYVAFHRDFQALDRILPADAILYVTDRIPTYYAPRPVVFTLDDLHGRKGPLYHFEVVSEDSEPQALSCPETVYQNPNAVAEVYRTPGRAAEHVRLRVARCNIAAGRISSGD